MCFAPIPYELRKPGCYGQFPSADNPSTIRVHYFNA